MNDWLACTPLLSKTSQYSVSLSLWSSSLKSLASRGELQSLPIRKASERNFDELACQSLVEVDFFVMRGDIKELQIEEAICLQLQCCAHLSRLRRAQHTGVSRARGSGSWSPLAVHIDGRAPASAGRRHFWLYSELFVLFSNSFSFSISILYLTLSLYSIKPLSHRATKSTESGY